MTSEELLQQAFEDKTTYPAEQLYHFRQDPLALEYLQTNYPEAYDFIHLPNLKIESYPDGIAAIGVHPYLRLLLNEHKLTFMKNKCSALELTVFYDTLACLLLHEELHYMLKHFRVPMMAYDHAVLNQAQDMIIDNRIHRKYPGWRNWQRQIDQINQAIDARPGCTLKKISADPKDPMYILHLSDMDLYFYLTALNIPVEEHNSFDDHLRDESDGGPTPTPEGASGAPGSQSPEGNQMAAPDPSMEPSVDSSLSETNNKESTDTTYDRVLEQLSKSALERVAKNEKRALEQEADCIDKTLQVLAQGKEHNLFNILKKFIKKISYKQSTNTWKKLSKKQPFYKPGVLYKKAPGEVLLMIDTSGSMHEFIRQHIADTMYSVYTAFSQVARFGPAAKIYKADVAEEVLNFRPIKSVEELKKIDLTRGGGNDFKEIFNELVLDWQHKTKSTQKFPDFILVLTDFGDDWSFLLQDAYKPVAQRIIWLCTEPHAFNRPPIGHIVNICAGDWYVSIR